VEVSVHSSSRLISISTVFLLLAGFSTVSHTQVVSATQPAGSIMLFPVPRDDLDNRGRVLARLKDHLRSDSRYRDRQRSDLVVIFTDESGQAILPERAAESSEPDAAARLAPNALSFTFDSPEHPWTPEQVAFLSSALNAFYPVAERIYGLPAFNISVNIRKDSTIPFAGLYFVSWNEMILRSATQGTLDVLCHEMLHAFRDDNIIGLASFEEGMVRAAEIEVFDRLIDYVHPFDEAHSYEYDVYYDALNRPEIGAIGGNLSDGYVSLLLRYQLAGYAWGKVLIENDQFLARFNRAYYRTLKKDPSTKNTESSLLKIAASAQNRVEGERFETWYSHQHVLNTAPPAGFALYHRIWFLSDFFERGSTGFVRMMPNAPVEWRVSDHNGVLLDAGSGLTAANGHLLFLPAIPAGYSGRLEVVASALTPNGRLVESTAFRPFISDGNAGIFGVVRHYNEGTLDIKSLDHPRIGATVSVANGVFTAPSLETVRGRFIGRFFAGGELKQVRIFTKDASHYFVSF
jgi:hypothetical protein